MPRSLAIVGRGSRLSQKPRELAGAIWRTSNLKNTAQRITGSRCALRGRLLQQTQEMFCVLVEILSRNGIVLGGGLARKGRVAVVALFRIGGNLPVATAPFGSRIASLVRR
jgi:hypothetical protein